MHHLCTKRRVIEKIVSKLKAIIYTQTACYKIYERFFVFSRLFAKIEKKYHRFKIFFASDDDDNCKQTWKMICHAGESTKNPQRSSLHTKSNLPHFHHSSFSTIFTIFSGVEYKLHVLIPSSWREKISGNDLRDFLLFWFVTKKYFLLNWLINWSENCSESH